MTGPFAPEWVDAALTALAGRMSVRTSPDGIAAAVLDAVVPLVDAHARADEARRIAEKLEARADQLACMKSADCTAHAKTLYAAARIVREEIA